MKNKGCNVWNDTGYPAIFCCCFTYCKLLWAKSTSLYFSQTRRCKSTFVLSIKKKCQAISCFFDKRISVSPNSVSDPIPIKKGRIISRISGASLEKKPRTGVIVKYCTVNKRSFHRNFYRKEWPPVSWAELAAPDASLVTPEGGDEAEVLGPQLGRLVLAACRHQLVTG